MHHFRKRRVREYARLQVRIRALERPGDRVTLDQLGHLGADHMRAKKLARAGIEHRLDEALDLAKSNGLAVADVGKFSDLDLAPALFGFGFGQTNAGNLRPTIGAAGNLGRIERMHALHAGNALGDDDAFMHGLVREPGRTDEVADRP